MGIKSLQAKARNIEPSVRIGKFGATSAIIEEIKRQLKARKLVKIKLLKNAPVEDVGEFAEDISAKTGAQLVDVVGRVVVLYRD